MRRNIALFSLISLVLLASVYTHYAEESNCSIGHCLECGKDNNCKLCAKGTTLKNGSCSGPKTTIDNCKYTNERGCFACKNGYAARTSTNPVQYEARRRLLTSILVPTLAHFHAAYKIDSCPRKTKIENCLNSVLHGEHETCFICNPGYISKTYKSGTHHHSKCEKVSHDKKINNCNIYDSAGTCIQCKDGHMLDDTATHKDSICKEKVEKQTGLLSHCMHMDKEGKCHQCQRGYWAVGFNVQGQHQVCGKRLSDKHAAKVIAIHAKEAQASAHATNNAVNSTGSHTGSGILQIGIVGAVFVMTQLW